MPPEIQITPAAGSYVTAQTITITPLNFEGGAIFYTLDGSDPRDSLMTIGGQVPTVGGEFVTIGDVR